MPRVVNSTESGSRPGGVAGICFIRDARDIVPFLCGHYLRAGFDHLHFVDDGSSDGTFEFLSRLAGKTGRVSVEAVTNDTDRQPDAMTDAANRMIGNGYRIIVPFDSDEFWHVDAEQLERLCADAEEFVFFGRWQNFVQRRDRIAPSPFGLFHMLYRVPRMDDADRETVTSFRRPFAGYTERKVAFKTRSEVRLARGQHNLIKGPMVADETEFEIFHLPLRYRSEIVKRALNYEPRLRRSSPEEGWQSAFHAKMVHDKRTDELWAANSVGPNGTLDVGGTPTALEPDDRLRALIGRALIYVMARWPMVCLRR